MQYRRSGVCIKKKRSPAEIATEQSICTLSPAALYKSTHWERSCQRNSAATDDCSNTGNHTTPIFALPIVQTFDFPLACPMLMKRHKKLAWDSSKPMSLRSVTTQLFSLPHLLPSWSVLPMARISQESRVKADWRVSVVRSSIAAGVLARPAWRVKYQAHEKH